MSGGTALMLAFGTFLVGALLVSSGLRNRSLADVLAGHTSLVAEEAAHVEAAQASAPGGAPGGGTAGDQKRFVQAFARYSGLDPRVVETWALAEQPPGSPATKGSNNWLNVQYTDSGPNAEYFRIAKLSPEQAAKASVEWTAKQSGLRGILASKGKPPALQWAAIQQSGWASSHYAGVTLR